MEKEIFHPFLGLTHGLLIFLVLISSVRFECVAAAVQGIMAILVIQDTSKTNLALVSMTA